MLADKNHNGLLCIRGLRCASRPRNLVFPLPPLASPSIVDLSKSNKIRIRLPNIGTFESLNFYQLNLFSLQRHFSDVLFWIQFIYKTIS